MFSKTGAHKLAWYVHSQSKYFANHIPELNFKAENPQDFKDKRHKLKILIIRFENAIAPSSFTAQNLPSSTDSRPIDSKIFSSLATGAEISIPISFSKGCFP